MRKSIIVLLVLVVAGFFVTAHCQPEENNNEEGGKQIMLPEPQTTGETSVEEAIAQRRSIRQFTDENLTIEQTGQLAWAAQGITEQQSGFRAAPSAGATYPMELYLVSAEGVRHYEPEGHKLIELSGQDLRQELSGAALGQSAVRDAAVDIVITAVFRRTTARYGDRGRQYVYTEAGHIAENIHLQAISLGLGSVPIGAFDPPRVSLVLDLPEEHEPIYIIPVGHPQ